MMLETRRHFTSEPYNKIDVQQYFGSIVGG
jgi:hypothetical protein